MSHPYEIRLVVTRDDDGYTARWIEPEGQESEPFPLSLPLAADDTAELRWYLETYLQFPGAGDRVRAEAVEEQIKKWGRALFDASFAASEGTNVFRNLMQAADDDRPCLLTIGATDADILLQPWEMMRDREHNRPLVFQGVTIRRQLRGSRRTQEQQQALPLRVLLIVSRPSDISFIDPRNSIAPLLDALKSLSPGRAVVDFCDPPTLPRLEELISRARKSQAPYAIVHFDGHGTYLPHTGVGALAFERADATTELVSGSDLGDLLVRLDVPLVLLEACRSAGLSDKPVFGSVAAGEDVPAVPAGLPPELDEIMRALAAELNK
jgi:hypothetical protein